MKHESPTASDKHQGHGSVASYVTGFVLSVVLTLAAYVLVANKLLSGGLLVAAIVGLAIAQLFVQLLFFLHLGSESKPRWNLTALLFAAMVVVILVIGSLWIMYNLDYQHADMTGEELDQYIMEDEGIRR
jgi:cytochrome o ubiquinol oxidase subunit IV